MGGGAWTRRPGEEHAHGLQRQSRDGESPPGQRNVRNDMARDVRRRGPRPNPCPMSIFTFCVAKAEDRPGVIPVTVTAKESSAVLEAVAGAKRSGERGKARCSAVAGSAKGRRRREVRREGDGHMRTRANYGGDAWTRRPGEVHTRGL